MKNICGLVFVVMVGGCVGRGVPQWSNSALIDAAGQRQLSDSLRLKVIDEVLGRQLDPDEKKRLGEVFGEVVGSSLHSPVIRGRVLEAIREDYKADGPVWLGAAVVDCGDKNLRGQIVDTLVELADKRAIGYLAEAMEQDGDSDKTLAGAIEKISGQPLAAAMKELLQDSKERLGARMAGLVCLANAQGKATAREFVMSAGAKDGFLENLLFWAANYDYLPGNMMSFYMCVQQMGTLSAESLAGLPSKLMAIKQRDEYEFDICDSHLLLRSGGAVSLRSRDELAAEIGRRLGELGHTKRAAGYSGADDDYREDFTGRCNLFSYTDLLRISLLLNWLGTPGNTDTVRGFLRADAAQRLSEIGGLWFLNDAGEVEFVEYQPRTKAGDNQYIESDELFSDAAMCLGRWHCHVDQWRGKELAGPGSDDIRYGRYVHTPIVVITLLDENMFNVDYLSASSVVLDLGNY